MSRWRGSCERLAYCDRVRRQREVSTPRNSSPPWTSVTTLRCAHRAAPEPGVRRESQTRAPAPTTTPTTPRESESMFNQSTLGMLGVPPDKTTLRAEYPHLPSPECGTGGQGGRCGGQRKARLSPYCRANSGWISAFSETFQTFWKRKFSKLIFPRVSPLYSALMTSPSLALPSLSTME